MSCFQGDIPSLLQQCSPPGVPTSPPSSLPSVPSAAVAAAAAITPRTNYPTIVPKVEPDQISQQILLQCKPYLILSHSSSSCSSSSKPLDVIPADSGSSVRNGSLPPRRSAQSRASGISKGTRDHCRMRADLLFETLVAGLLGLCSMQQDKSEDRVGEDRQHPRAG